MACVGSWEPHGNFLRRRLLWNFWKAKEGLRSKRNLLLSPLEHAERELHSTPQKIIPIYPA